MALASLFVGWTLGMMGLVIIGGSMFFDTNLNPLGRMLVRVIGAAIMCGGMTVLARA